MHVCADDYYVCTHEVGHCLGLDLGPYHCHDYVLSLRSHHNHPHLNHDVEYLSVDRNVSAADLASKVYAAVLCSHSDLHPL